MLKYFILLILFPLASCTDQEKVMPSGHKILLQNYSLLIIDNEIHKLHQSNDTVYELHCYTDRPCAPKPEKHYKILSAVEKSNYVILKLERLDSLSHNAMFLSPKRYVLLALKDITDKKLGYLPLRFSLTKAQIDTIRTGIDSLQEKFFFTYFSDTALKEFANLKPLTTKKDAEAILEMIKSKKYQQTIDSYKKTKTMDMYNAGISAELFNKACIDLGFNVLGAGAKFNSLMK